VRVKEGRHMLCRHCKKCPVNRPRGLCHGCYYAPGGIRELYPKGSANPATAKYVPQCRSEPAACWGCGTPCPNPTHPTRAPGWTSRMVRVASGKKPVSMIQCPGCEAAAGDWTRHTPMPLFTEPAGTRWADDPPWDHTPRGGKVRRGRFTPVARGYRAVG
jgi:hypothetical protein